MTDLVIDATKVGVVRVPGQAYETFTVPLGEAMTVGQYGRLNTTTGKAEPGNATVAAEARSGGILISKDGAGKVGTFLRKGILDLGTALDALTYDDDVFLSNTDGTLADVAGTVSKIVGTTVPGFGDVTPRRLLRVDL